jgi:ComF family protein
MWNHFGSLFLQGNCPLCDRVAVDCFCSACDRQLQRQKFAHPEYFWQGELPLFVWGQYGGLLKRALTTLKYDNHPEVADLLGMYLAQSWRSFAPQLPQKQFTVVPIPLHANKLKQRGFNQAERIGRSFCRFSRLRLDARLLMRSKETEALFGLSAVEREQSLKDAFAVRQPSRSRPPSVLIIDDIYTTGNTARAATAVLQQQGIAVAGILAIATSQPQPSKM